MNHEDSWEEYYKFMNSNLEKKKNYHKSSHIVIQKLLHLIVENSVILKNLSVSEDTLLRRKISYEIDKFGKNVKMRTKNKKYKNVKMDEITGRRIYILVSLKLVEDMPGMNFFDEFGRRLETKDLKK